MRISLITLIAAGSVAVGGCAYGGLNVGYGYGDYGYGDYGYGYGSPYYGGYGGYGYGSPWGWYGDYYYPGTGIYVYDTYRRPRTWSDRERRYWTSRQTVTTSGTKTVSVQPNWSGFTAHTERHHH